MAPTALINVPRAFDKETQQSEEVGTKVGDSYFTISAQFVFAIPLIEATDEELMYLVEKSGAFSFWASPEEDIYTLEDGSSLQ